MQIELHHGGNRIPTIGCVDTGASCNVIDAEFAQVLGIPLSVKHHHEVSGIGGRVSGYKQKIGLFLPTLGGAQFEVEVVFAEKWNRDYALLGRNGFLEHVTIAVRERYQEMYFHVL